MPFPGHVSRNGWGVVRSAPWHLAGVYDTKKEAENVAASLGSDYEVHFGEQKVGSDDFVWSGESSK